MKNLTNTNDINQEKKDISNVSFYLRNNKNKTLKININGFTGDKFDIPNCFNNFLTSTYPEMMIIAFVAQAAKATRTVTYDRDMVKITAEGVESGVTEEELSEEEPEEVDWLYEDTVMAPQQEGEVKAEGPAPAGDSGGGGNREIVIIPPEEEEEEEEIIEEEPEPPIIEDIPEAPEEPTPPPPDADLSVTTEIVSPILPLNNGDSIEYLIEVTNSGPNDAQNVKVNAPLPAGLVYNSDTASGGIYNPVTGVWDIGTLAVGETLTLTLETAGIDFDLLSPGQLNSLVQEATIESSTFDSDLSSNIATSSINPQDADIVNNLMLFLANDVDGDGRMDPGDTIAYFHELINFGPDPVPFYSVGFFLSPDLTYLPGNFDVIFFSPLFPSGANSTIGFLATINAGPPDKIIATISEDIFPGYETYDPNPDNNDPTNNPTVIIYPGANVFIGTLGVDNFAGDPGGVEYDRFIFTKDDIQPSPVTDTITNFTIGAGEDILDIGDMLEGISPLSPANLDNYLSFTPGATTSLEITVPSGTHFITFVGVDLFTLTGAVDNEDLIGDLLGSGNLDVDFP